MNKKLMIFGLLALTLLTINVCAAQEAVNSTDIVNELSISEEPVLEVNNNSQSLKSASVNTHIDVAGKTDFDVIGDYFKVKLSDSNNNVLKNTKVTFTVNGKSYAQSTDSSGIASLQIRLNDGSYNIVTKFAGNSNYKASSLSTKITMDNTREVESGMGNSQIQSIIDNAKANNVILFKGSSYSDINLVIAKSLTLQSNVGTTLKSSSSSPVITIKGSKASLTKVKGFKIDGNGDGIYVDGVDYVTIYNNDITCKGNGIVALDTKYLNITKNDIVKNSKSGIILAKSSHAYIFNNKITGNAANAIGVAKSDIVYIHGNTISNNKNGIYLGKTINGINYGEGPNSVYINKNTISKNENNGILVQNAGNNINIKSNTVDSNKENGIALSAIGSNTIQSNVIQDNWANGIKFFDEYVKPKNQDISYNAIFNNLHMDVEAKDTYYQENGVKLDLGDNWYTDFAGVCPKISTNNIKFTVKQIGLNQFQATFTDSNGNIASLLPDRTLTYTTNNGQKVSIPIKGGTGVFTVDANDGDLVKATVDNSRRDNTYDSSTKSTPATNGQTPSYSYPSIPSYQLYEDIGNGGGNGNGNGDGTGGSANRGTGTTVQDSNSNGNSTHSQKADPSNSANNQVNDVSQSYNTPDTAAAGASGASSGDTGNLGSEPQSVVKQIIIDEDEFFKITGISFIILLMILTVGFYYRDDIKEMNSKRWFIYFFLFFNFKINYLFILFYNI